MNIYSFRDLEEHAIGGAKRYLILKDRFRCHKFGFNDLVMELAFRLHNLIITMNVNIIYF